MVREERKGKRIDDFLAFYIKYFIVKIFSCVITYKVVRDFGHILIRCTREKKVENPCCLANVDHSLPGIYRIKCKVVCLEPHNKDFSTKYIYLNAYTKIIVYGYR